MSRNPSIILITKLPIRNEAILVSYTRASNGARSGHGGRADSKMHDRRLGRLCLALENEDGGMGWGFTGL